MSADNWAVCPACLKNAQVKRIADLEDLKKSYGKVSAEQYIARADELRPEIDKEKFWTFREDYELGTDSEEFFSIRYSGSCTECGFSHKYGHEEPLDLTIKRRKR